MPAYSSSDIARQDVPASPSSVSLDNSSAASDQAMFIHLAWQDTVAGRIPTAVDWDGVAAELVEDFPNPASGTGFATYVITGPATGVNNVGVIWSGGNAPIDLIVIITTMSDASQTVPINASVEFDNQSNAATDSVTTDEDNCSIIMAVATQEDAGFGFGSPLIEREFQIATEVNTYQISLATENDAGTAGLKTRSVNGNDAAQLFHGALIAVNPASVVGSTPAEGGDTVAKAPPGVTASGVIDPGNDGATTVAKASPGVTSSGTIDPGNSGASTNAKTSPAVQGLGTVDPGASGSAQAAKALPEVLAAGIIDPGAQSATTTAKQSPTATGQGIVDPGNSGSSSVSRSSPLVAGLGTVDPGASGGASVQMAAKGVISAGTVTEPVQGSAAVAKASPGVSGAGLADGGVNGSGIASKVAPSALGSGIVDPGAIGSASIGKALPAVIGLGLADGAVAGGGNVAKLPPGVVTAGIVEPAAIGQGLGSIAKGVIGSGTVQEVDFGAGTVAKLVQQVTGQGIVDPGAFGSAILIKPSPGVLGTGVEGDPDLALALLAQFIEGRMSQTKSEGVVRDIHMIEANMVRANAVHDLERYIGETNDFILEMDEDVTGSTFVMVLNAQHDPESEATNVFEIAGVIDDVDNTIVTFSPTIGDVTQSPGVYYYQTWRTDAQGIITSPTAGSLRLKRGLGFN